MAFGGVNVPGVGGPVFVSTKQKTVDAYAAGKVFSFGEMQKRQFAELDRYCAGGVLRFGELHTQHQLNELYGEVNGETHVVNLTNTKKFPFNSTVDSPVTVALSKVRRNLFYTVEAEITTKNGLVDEVIVTDKALNGFKIGYNGSATSATLTVRIKGGMA